MSKVQYFIAAVVASVASLESVGFSVIQKSVVPRHQPTNRILETESVTPEKTSTSKVTVLEATLRDIILSIGNLLTPTANFDGTPEEGLRPKSDFEDQFEILGLTSEANLLRVKLEAMRFIKKQRETVNVI